MVFEISIAVIAVAFVILVIYLTATLIAVRKSLHIVNQSLEKLSSKLLPITEETVRLIKSSQDLTEDVLKKSASLDPLFHSISQVSQYIHDAASSIGSKKKICSFLCDEETEGEKSSQVVDWVECALMGLIVWQKFKQRK